jgi:hypothetical protein
MDFQTIERMLLHLVQKYAGNFPAEQVAGMTELVQAGEAGIAFENLCTQLHEYDISVDEATVGQLKDIGSQMGIEPDYWEQLKT